MRYIQTIFWWAVLWSAQRLWTWLFAERLLTKLGIGGEENPVSIFVDMCTLAKVSVVVLDEQYHGYYLHCCSPHEYGDCSMAELIDYLRTDAHELSTNRGLHWIKAGRDGLQKQSSTQKACGAYGPPQTFEFIASPDWKTHYEGFLQRIHQTHADALLAPEESKAMWTDRIKKVLCCCVKTVDITLIDQDLLEDTYKDLNHFISSSINKDLQNYPIREEPKAALQTFLGLIPKVRLSFVSRFVPSSPLRHRPPLTTTAVLPRTRRTGRSQRPRRR